MPGQSTLSGNPFAPCYLQLLRLSVCVKFNDLEWKSHWNVVKSSTDPFPTTEYFLYMPTLVSLNEDCGAVPEDRSRWALRLQNWPPNMISKCRGWLITFIHCNLFSMICWYCIFSSRDIIGKHCQKPVQVYYATRLRVRWKMSQTPNDAASLNYKIHVCTVTIIEL